MFGYERRREALLHRWQLGLLGLGLGGALLLLLPGPGAVTRAEAPGAAPEERCDEVTTAGAAFAGPSVRREGRTPARRCVGRARPRRP
jgi:hypothetical protein